MNGNLRHLCIASCPVFLQAGHPRSVKGRRMRSVVETSLLVFITLFKDSTFRLSLGRILDIITRNPYENYVFCR
jgi:hypothetical protein